MVKTLFLLFICITCSCLSNVETQDITGLWKSRDQDSDQPRALVVIYKYKDMYYGRMLATYDEDGQFNDTILEQKDKAPGVVGNPPYCGMDFIYNVKREGANGEDYDKYKGKIIDPEKGKVYNAEFWLSGEDLIVRGELWIFGKNIPWHKATKEDLPKGFSMSAVQKFVPVIPKTS